MQLDMQNAPWVSKKDLDQTHPAPMPAHIPWLILLTQAPVMLPSSTEIFCSCTLMLANAQSICHYDLGCLSRLQAEAACSLQSCTLGNTTLQRQLGFRPQGRQLGQHYRPLPLRPEQLLLLPQCLYRLLYKTFINLFSLQFCFTLLYYKDLPLSP